MSKTQFLSKEEEQLVVQAIQSAEHQTGGEIRVHIESICKGNVLDRAAWQFKSLKMHKTALRNGVLIYLSTDDRKFAIIGDAGINAVVPEGFDQPSDLDLYRGLRGCIFFHCFPNGKPPYHFPPGASNGFSVFGFRFSV